jgi:adhesin transport system outer membrane protein
MNIRALLPGVLLIAAAAAWAPECVRAEATLFPVNFDDTPEKGVKSRITDLSETPVTPKKRSVPGTGDVSLAEAVTMALQWHPSIKRAEREYAQSKESINEAKSGWYPSENARIKSGIQQYNYSHKNAQSNTLEISASQTLYDFGRTQSKVDLANASMKRSASGLQKSENDIAYETVNAFIQAIRYQQLVTIARVQVEGIEAINKLAEMRTSQGASAESDYSQSKVRLAAAIAQLHDYEAQSFRWNAVLDNVTNQPIATTLNRHLTVEGEAACFRVDINEINSPAIALAQAQIKMADKQVNALKAEYYPTLSITPTWEYELEDEQNANGHRAKKGEWGIFLNVSAALYEGGARLSRTHQAEQALQASHYNLETERTEARRKVLENTSQIAALRESLQAKRQREAESIRTRDLYRLQYLELGSRSFSDLLSAESEIHQTRIDILSAELTVATMAFDCLYYSGHLLKFFAQ